MKEERRHPRLIANCARSWLFVLVLVISAISCLSCAKAQTSTPGGYFIPSLGQPLHGSFDHNKTKFPLTGAHAQTVCEACHFNGQYKTTLYACPACHNGARTIGKPPTHPPTSLKCAGCHQTTLFSDIRVIDHTQASTKCAACHDGKIARGRSDRHAATAAPCQTCHQSTTNFYSATAAAKQWALTAPTAPLSVASALSRRVGSAVPGPAVAAPSTANLPLGAATPAMSSRDGTANVAGIKTASDGSKFDHARATGTCAFCHNGRTASGKPPRHIATMAACDSCHKNTRTFAGARFDHGAVTAPCITCHNGRDAPGKSARHVMTNAPCDECHKNKITFERGAPNVHSRRM